LQASCPMVGTASSLPGPLKIRFEKEISFGFGIGEQAGWTPCDPRSVSLNATNAMNAGRYYALAQCGIEMVAPMIGGVYLDKWFNTNPIFTISTVVLGFVGGITHMIIISNQIEKAEKEEKERKKHE